MKTIQGGLSYLAGMQQADGGFGSDSSPSLTPWQPIHHYQTSFTSALILACLSHLEEALPIRDKLASFVGSQKSPGWSFNYWVIDAPERNSLPYPDDLDDTFCSLIGLYVHDPKLVNENALAGVVKLLVATETKPGGPYRTWLVPATADKIWQDIDLAVNANIAYFLSLVSNRLPELDKMIQKSIKEQAFSSPYYPSAFPVLYYLARACPETSRPKLAKIISAVWRDTKRPTALEAALTLTTLVRLDQHSSLTRKLYNQLVNGQGSDGSWPASAFCLDPALDKQHYYSGCAALTTAFCLEAVASYQKTSTLAVKARKSPVDARAERLQTKIIERANQRFESLAPNLRQQAQLMLQKLVKGDAKHEITLLPYLFTRSLLQPPDVSDRQLVELGLANLYGWIAYTIYDDFLDDEGQPLLLSVANVALRSSLLSFQRALPDNKQFQEQVEQTFDVIDGANTWEIANCRFKADSRSLTIGKLPNYSRRAKLAERSLGHGLTPLAILLVGGRSINNSNVQAIDQAFRHYLIARQINDDAHDWKEDVRRGHITYVVGTILSSSIQKKQPAFSSLLPAMESQFWHHSLIDICKTIQIHLRLGRQQLTQQSLLAPDSLISKLLDGVELSVNQSLLGQAQAVRFLRSYREKPARNLK